jgi:hypothetical protein
MTDLALRPKQSWFAPPSPVPASEQTLIYASPDRTVRFVADPERYRRARSLCVRYVARLGPLCARHHVRLHRHRALQQNETRSREDDPLFPSATDAHRLHHRRFRVSWRGGFARSEVPLARRNLPYPAAHRNVHGQRQRRFESSDLARQAGDSALAADTDANLVHWPDLVGL